MSRQRSLWLLFGIILSGVLLRLYHLGARSIWFDEAFTWQLIQFPWSDLVHRATLDVHPPLYYILVKAWSVVFGSGIIALRSFSLLMAAFTMGAAYLFVTTVTRHRRAGVLAAALIAFSGWHIAFSWETRMYVLGTALALFSSYLLLKAVEQKKQSFGWWVAYGLTAAAFAYTHYYSFFTLAAQALFVLGYILVQTRGRIGEILQSKLFWAALLSAALAIVLYLPWLPILLNQNSQVQSSFWIPALDHWSVPDTFYRMLLPTARYLNHDGWHKVAALTPFILFTLISLGLVVHRQSRQFSGRTGAWLIVLSLYVPFIISVGLSLSGQSLYQDRYFIFAFVFMICALAAAISAIPWTTLRRSVMTIAVVGFLFGFIHYWQELAIDAHPGVQAASEAIYTNDAKAEPVIVTSSFIYFSVAHYAQDEYRATRPLLLSPDGQLANFAGGPILQKSDVIGPDFFAKENKGFWLVDTTGFGSSVLPVPSGWKVTNQSKYSEVFGYQGDIIVRHLQK